MMYAFDSIVWRSELNIWPMVISWIVTFVIVVCLMLIWSYLNNKCPGQQSVMDVANKFFIECGVLAKVVGGFARSIQVLMADAGETIAFGLSWVAYVTMLMLEFSIFGNALVQAMLVAWPRLIGSDTFEKAVKWGLRFGVPVLCTCLSFTFHSLVGLEPDSYYIFRGMGEKLKVSPWSLCTITRAAVGVSALLTLFGTRTAIYIWNRNGCSFMCFPQKGHRMEDRSRPVGQG